MQQFPDWEMEDGVTDLDEDYFNAILQDIDDRLNRAETGGTIMEILVPGALTTGRKAIFKLPFACDSLKVSLSAPDYTAGAAILVNLYSGGEPGGGATGTALYSNGARPTIATSGAEHNAGASNYAETDQNLPLASGVNIAVDVEQADLGPVSNLRITILLIPTAP